MLVLLGIALLYLGVANALLRTSLLRHLMSRDPVAMRVEYDSAYSLYPFHVNVEGLSIRGRDRNVEWLLTLGRGDFRVSPWQLLKRRFHATHVHGDGIALRVRLRREAKDNTAERVAALPPISGFADPPLADPIPPPPPLTDAEYKLWAVELSDIELDHVREIWVDEIRYAGELRVRGSLLFRPVRRLEVGPATADVRALEIAHGPRTLAADFHGKVTATVHTFDVREPAGIALLKHVSVDGDLHGTAPSYENLNAVLHVPHVDGIRGGGPVDLRLVADHGVLLAGTHAESRSDDTRIDAVGMSIATKLRVHLDVDEDNGHAVTRFGAHADDAAMRGPGNARASAAQVAATFTSWQRDLTGSFGDAMFAAEAHGGAIDDLAGWGSLLPTSAHVSIESGSLKLDGRVEGSLADRHGQGELTFAARRVSATREQDRIVADAAGVVRLEDASLTDGWADLTGTDVTVRDASARLRGLDLRVSAIHGRASKARVGKDGLSDLDVDVDVTRLATPDLSGMRALLGGGVDVLRGSAVASGRFHASARAHSARGAATILAEHAAVRIDKVDVASSHLTARLDVRTWNWADGRVDLSGSDVVARDLGARASAGTPNGGMPGPTVVGTLSLRGPRFVVHRGALEGTLVGDVIDASVADLRGLETVVPLPKGLIVDRGRAQVRGHVEIDLASRSASGMSAIEIQAAEVHIGKQSITGDLTAHVRAQAVPSAHALDFGGSIVDLSNIATHGDGHPVRGWHSRFDFREAVLLVEGGVKFRTRLHFEARDAVPVVALLGTRTGLPKWTEPALRMRGVQCDGVFRLALDLADIRGLVAKGEENVLVQMNFAQRGDVEDGAVLVHVGELGVGVGLGNTSVVFIGADTWFVHRSAEVSRRFPLDW